MDQATDQSEKAKIQEAPKAKPQSRNWISITALGVSIIAVIISAFSVYFASIQSEYSRIQAENSRIQAENARIQSEHSRIQAEIVSQSNLPNINVTQKNELDGKDKSEISIITISNEGGPLSEFDCKEVTFLYVMLSDVSKGYPILADIPLAAFYGDTVLTGRAKGIVCRFQGGDFAKYKKLAEALIKIHDEAYPDRKLKLTADMMTYLRVKYRDVLDKSHTDYLSVQPGRDMQRIESRDWNSLYKKQGLNMKTVKGEDLKRIYTEVISTHFPK
jgi:hypothetical protein